MNNINWKKYNYQSSYYFQIPFQKVLDLYNEYGKPSLLNNRMAIWDKNQLKGLYERIDIIDSPVYNYFPYPHIGFMYVYYKYTIPLNKLCQILSLSGDIKYDTLEKIIIIRTMSLGYCNSLLVLIIRFCSGNISWHEIKSKFMIKQYLSISQLTNIKTINSNILYLYKNTLH